MLAANDMGAKDMAGDCDRLDKREETMILRRGAATNCSMSRLVSFVFLFASSVPLENAHPLQGGLLRRKYRLDRRPGLPIEPMWSFYPKYAWNFVTKYSRAVRLLLWLHQTNRRLQRDPNRYKYTDIAMTLSRRPVGIEIGLEATDRVERDGIAVGTATVYDREGPLGSVITAALANSRRTVDLGGVTYRDDGSRAG